MGGRGSRGAEVSWKGRGEGAGKLRNSEVKLRWWDVVVFFFRILSKTPTIAIISPLVKEPTKLSEKSPRMSAHEDGLSIAFINQLKLQL